MPRHWQSTFLFLALERIQPRHGKAEDKPAWWPKIPKWKEFRAPSKASKDECTLLIKLLLEQYSLDTSIYYMNYPDEEVEDSSEFQ